jgi:hypothetical protein
VVITCLRTLGNALLRSSGRGCRCVCFFRQPRLKVYKTQVNLYVNKLKRKLVGKDWSEEKG